LNTEIPNSYLIDVLESISSGLIAVDARGRISVFNRAAAELLGCKACDVLGISYAEIFAHETGVRKDCLYTLHTGHPLSLQEGTIHTRYGRVIPVRFSTMAVKSAGGEITGAIEIFDDLSDLKNLEARLEQSRTHAALGEMAANVAHQIRNPLGGIGGFAALLERDHTLNDEQRRLVRKIIEGVASLDRIITELLMFTRPLLPSLRRVNVQRALVDIIASLKRHWAEAGLKIDCELDLPEEPIWAELDPQLFHEMIWYLFGDAVGFMSENGGLRARLSCRERAQRFAIEVQDPNRLLKEEERTRLFYPFYTLCGSGVGLSLAIVRRIVERHHGEIMVTSEPRTGTVYRVELPGVDELRNA
jgi:PAS domain S-box-containing protein